MLITFPPDTFLTLAPIFVAWAWLIVAGLAFWYLRPVKEYIDDKDFFKTVRWVYWEVLLPSEAEQTPKAMEIAIAVWSGIHKGPDAYEKYFEGYQEAWYSLELHCVRGKARYILVAPASQRQFFEGVIYGQYPTAQIKEVPDHTLRFTVDDLGKKIDAFGSDIIFAKPSVYPLRTYRLYDDPLAPEEHFIDPHQALVEAYTNIREGEEFWLQLIIRPIDAGEVAEWTEKGEEEIEKIKEANAPEGSGTHFFDPVETAKMKGILDKTLRETYVTKIRVVYIAPPNGLRAENAQRAIGAFNQFNTLHLNALILDPKTRSDGPVYSFRDVRRRYRRRRSFYYFQIRYAGRRDGEMMNAEEIATLYHFPSKWIKAPGLERVKAASERPPANLPVV